VRDALARDADWHELAGVLGMHPQAAFETCAHLAGHRNTPARQRPDLAVVLTAGLAAEHDMRREYGIDIKDLSPDHSLHTEPGVRRVRDAAELVGDDVWITVTTPGDFEGAEGDPTPGVDAIQQWASVVAHPAELTWVREMLALNASAAALIGLGLNASLGAARAPGRSPGRSPGTCSPSGCWPPR
jgi:hypothetical protein